MKPEQQPSGSWRLKVYVGKDLNGKNIYKSVTRRTKRECMTAAINIKNEYKEIRDDPSCMILKDACQKYLDERSNILSPQTIAGHKVTMRNSFQPEMGRRLNSMSKADWQRAVNREAEHLSPKTVWNRWGFINAVLSEYHHRFDDLKLPAKQKYRAAYLNKTEVATLLNAARGHHYELPIWLAVALGLRRSEIIALTWDDYDPIARTLDINKAMVQDENRNWVVKGNKTYESSRVITVPSRVSELLDFMERTSDRIYTHSPHNIYKHLTILCKKNGLKHVRLHDLRHTAASIYLSNGASDKGTMEHFGWANTQTMKNIYQHTFAEDIEDAETKVNAFFDEIG